MKAALSLTECVAIVYDISKYTDVHPGGVQVLREVAGTNATTAFHDVGHSEDALETLQKFLIGTLDQQEEVRVRPVFTFTVVDAASPKRRWGFEAFVTISKSGLQQTLALVCIVFAARLLWPDFLSFSAASEAISAVPSFWKGAGLSLAASAALVSVTGREIGKSLDMTDGLRRYPPIMKPVKALSGPTRAALPASKSGHFQSCSLLDRVQLNSNTYKFTLSNRDGRSKKALNIPVGQHVQIRADIQGVSTTRSYTPTHIDTNSGSMELTIKVYPNSKMGSHLLSLPVGTLIDVRGPLGNFKNYHRFLCNDLFMIVGGTGITPIWQVTKAICADPADNTRMTLLYSNRTQGDILLRQEIDALAAEFPDKLRVYYFVSEGEETAWTGEQGRITAATLAEKLPATSKFSKYLLCGPDSMVSEISTYLVQLGCNPPKRFNHTTDQVFIF